MATKTSLNPEALSVQQVADVLFVSESTIRNMIRAGALKAVRIGPRLFRIPRSELSRLRTLQNT
jgi:excisionase family DNA binding protein